MSEFKSRLRHCRTMGLAGALVGAGLGLVGVTGSGSMSSAQAQEAAPAPQATADGCSGLMCVFAPSHPAPATPAPQPVAAPTEDTITPPAASAVQVKTKPKPVRALTISVDAAQAPRVRALAASMPKERIKVVTGTDSDTDFAIATAFDPHKGAAKAKLFTETLHVVAGGSIRSLADLRGKLVSFGADRSASQAVARKAFQSLAIDVRETPLEVDNALDGLSTGDIDAVVILAPEPVENLKTIATPGLHLVAWPAGGSLPDGAATASIDGADYPRLAQPGDRIAALGVDAVLTVSPRAAHLPAAKTFLAALSQHSAALSRHGFDLLKADLDSREDRRVASVERR